MSGPIMRSGRFPGHRLHASKRLLAGCSPPKTRGRNFKIGGTSGAPHERSMSENTVPAPPPSVPVVVPVKNESGNIGPLVDEIAAALAERSFEVICVDDGSRDGTDEVLSTLQADRPWLRHLKHVVSCGQSAALRSGV